MYVEWYGTCITFVRYTLDGTVSMVKCSSGQMVRDYSVTVRVRARVKEWVSFFFFFEHNNTPSGKKTVTGMQVVTTSQVQIIRCRSKAIL